MEWRFWRWTQRDNDLSDEIAHDLAADAEERVRSGTPRAEAELASRRDFGNVSLVNEDVREIWIWASLQRLSQTFATAGAPCAQTGYSRPWLYCRWPWESEPTRPSIALWMPSCCVRCRSKMPANWQF